MINPIRERITSAFDRELSETPAPQGLRDRAVRAATANPQRRRANRRPQLLAMLATLLAITLVVTLIAANRVLRSTPVPAAPTPTPVPAASPSAVALGGSWTTEPSLPFATSSFTATLLPGSNVLIAGGRVTIEASGATARVEIYDPATHTYTSARSMSIARGGHTATVLPSGKVLVAGGFTQSGFAALRSAEVYDPTSGTWSSVTPMANARTNHAAVLLANGKVLVTGGSPRPATGISPQGSAPASMPAEIYDPATDSWSRAATPILDRPVSPSATLLRDGRVLVVGGQYMLDSPDEATEASEIYNPRTNRWSATRPETRLGARQYHSATLLPSGRVLVAGTMIDEQPTSTAALYDPVTDSWTQLPNMNDSRCGAAAQLLAGGAVLIAGGGCGFAVSDGRDTAEEFDPSANRWVAAGNLSEARGLSRMVRLNDGTVVVLGGQTAIGRLSSAVDRFHPA